MYSSAKSFVTVKNEKFKLSHKYCNSMGKTCITNPSCTVIDWFAWIYVRSNEWIDTLVSLHLLLPFSIRSNHSAKLDQLVDVLIETQSRNRITDEDKNRLRCLLGGLLNQSIYHRDIMDSKLICHLYIFFY